MDLDHFDRLDQVIYTWSERSLLGGKGMGPIASSLPLDRLEIWDPLLRERVWATWPEHDEAGLVYLNTPGGDIVINKRPVVAEGGRQASVAHVLMARDIPILDALALYAWDGWLHAWSGDPAPATLSWQALRHEAAPALADLRERTRRLPVKAIAELTAFVLADPGGDVSVVAAAEPPLELLCALAEIGDSVTERPWTFSTREGRDDSADHPRIVFLATEPGFSTRTVPRRRLRFGDQAADPELRVFAEALARSYRSDGRAVIDGLRPAQPATESPEIHAWAQSAQLAPGVLADVPWLLGKADHLTSSEREALSSPRGLAEISRFVAELTPTKLAGFLRVPALPRIVTELFQAAALRHCFEAPAGPTASADETLLDALAESRPSTDLIMRNVALGQDPLPDDALLRVATLARRLMHAESGRRATVAAVARRMPRTQLIAWVDDHARDEPEAAHIAVSLICERRGRSREERSRDAEILISRGALAEATAHIAGSPQNAAGLLHSLLTVVLGPHIDDPAVLDRLLAHPSPPAHLLYVLRGMLSDPGAAAHVDHVVYHQFFLRNGLPTPLYQHRRTPLGPLRAWSRRLMRPLVRPRPTLPPDTTSPTSDPAPPKSEMVVIVLLVCGLIAFLVFAAYLIAVRGNL